MTDSSPEPARPSEESVQARLAEAGLAIPAECLAGTRANLIVLQDHARTVREFGLDPRSASAMRFGA